MPSKIVREAEVERHIQISKIEKDIETLKDTHIAHIHDCMHRIDDTIKENRSHFNTRLDKLDSRIWMIMASSVTTLLGVVINTLFLG